MQHCCVYINMHSTVLTNPQKCVLYNRLDSTLLYAVWKIWKKYLQMIYKLRFIPNKTTFYYVLPYSVDFKAPQELWNPFSKAKAVPGKFHGPGRHSKHNYIQNWAIFCRPRAWQIVLIFNTVFLCNYNEKEVGLRQWEMEVQTLKSNENLFERSKWTRTKILRLQCNQYIRHVSFQLKTWNQLSWLQLLLFQSFQNCAICTTLWVFQISEG